MFRLDRRWVHSFYNYGVLNKVLKFKMVVIWHLPTWHQCSNICRLYPTLWHVAEATSGASSTTPNPNVGYVGGLRLPVSKFNTVRYDSLIFAFFTVFGARPEQLMSRCWTCLDMLRSSMTILHILQLAEYIKDYQIGLGWILAWGIWAMAMCGPQWSLFLGARSKILKTMTQSHPKSTLGQGYRQDRMAGQLHGSGD